MSNKSRLCRLNKFTATLYVNEKHKRAGIRILLVLLQKRLVRHNPRLTAALEVFHTAPRDLRIITIIQSSLTIGINMIRLTHSLCLCQYILFQPDPDRQKQTFPAHGAPPDQYWIPAFERLITQFTIPWTQRQTLSLNESSDPGLSLTHHNALKCVTHIQPSLWADPQTSGILTTSRPGRRTILVCVKEKGRSTQGSSDYHSHMTRYHNLTLKCRALSELPVLRNLWLTKIWQQASQSGRDHGRIYAYPCTM